MSEEFKRYEREDLPLEEALEETFYHVWAGIKERYGLPGSRTEVPIAQMDSLRLGIIQSARHNLDAFGDTGARKEIDLAQATEWHQATQAAILGNWKLLKGKIQQQAHTIKEESTEDMTEAQLEDAQREADAHINLANSLEV